MMIYSISTEGPYLIVSHYCFIFVDNLKVHLLDIHPVVTGCSSI